MRFISKTILIAIIVSSCNSTALNQENDSEYSEIQTVYEYKNDLNLFFQNEFKKELNQLGNGFIFFIPVNSCLPCVDETLNGLLAKKSFDKILNIIISGTSTDSLINIQIVDVCKKYKNKILLDKESQIFRYELNIGGPSIILIDPNNIYQIILSEEVWQEKVKYLPFLKF